MESKPLPSSSSHCLLHSYAKDNKDVPVTGDLKKIRELSFLMLSTGVEGFWEGCQFLCLVLLSLQSIYDGVSKLLNEFLL